MAVSNGLIFLTHLNNLSNNKLPNFTVIQNNVKPYVQVTAFRLSLSPSPRFHCMLCSHGMMSLLRLQAPWSRDWISFDVSTEPSISGILTVASSLDCRANCSKNNNYCVNFIRVVWVAWAWWATWFATVVTVYWTEHAVRPWVSHFTFLSFHGCKTRVREFLKNCSTSMGCNYYRELISCGFWVCLLQCDPSPLEKLRDLEAILVVVSVNKEKW